MTIAFDVSESLRDALKLQAEDRIEPAQPASNVIEVDFSGGTAESTIRALLYELRDGLSCLAQDGARGRLQRCDEAAMQKIATELLSWPGKTQDGKDRPWLPAWTKEEVETLIEVWREIR
jgi:hypothetical protein